MLTKIFVLSAVIFAISLAGHKESHSNETDLLLESNITSIELDNNSTAGNETIEHHPIKPIHLRSARSAAGQTNIQQNKTATAAAAAVAKKTTKKAKKTTKKKKATTKKLKLTTKKPQKSPGAPTPRKLTTTVTRRHIDMYDQNEYEVQDV